MIKEYQKKFIDFLVQSGALTFGDFTTKSGRKTPYFINTGNFDSGEKITVVSEFYAAHIVEKDLAKSDLIFGPAYKGIPLCVAVASALHRVHQTNIGFSFNRKEAKDHGDTGLFVGKKPKAGDRVLLVEDVITAGTTLREIIPLLKAQGDLEISGVVIAVDRCEKGAGDISARQEAEKEHGLKIFPIVTIQEIVGYLREPNSSGLVLTEELLHRIHAYWEAYAA